MPEKKLPPEEQIMVTKVSNTCPEVNFYTKDVNNKFTKKNTTDIPSHGMCVNVDRKFDRGDLESFYGLL
jgi:hypothetical protein